MDKTPDETPIFFSPSFEPALMARGSFGAVRLATAHLVISRRRALKIVALLRKMTCNLRYPMGLRCPL